MCTFRNVKLAVFDANDQNVFNAKAFIYINSLTAAATSVGSANVANVMRYDPTAQQYIYNWDTKGLVAGIYPVIVDLGEGACTDVGLSAYRSITLTKRK